MGLKQSKEEGSVLTTTPIPSKQTDAADINSMNAEELRLLQIQDMPKMARSETFDEKLYRKFSQEPLVPIGCLTTVYFLASGINSFYKRDAARSQKMMRLRVGAQFVTIMVFVGYAGMNTFNMQFRPNHELKKKQNGNAE